jgi:hypothetical protein
VLLASDETCKKVGERLCLRGEAMSQRFALQPVNSNKAARCDLESHGFTTAHISHLRNFACNNIGQLANCQTLYSFKVHCSQLHDNRNKQTSRIKAKPIRMPTEQHRGKSHKVTSVRKQNEVGFQ